MSKKKPWLWDAGQSGNPAGRPKLEKCFQAAARKLLSTKDFKISWTVNGHTKELNISSDHNMYYGIAATMIIESLKGNHQAAKELIDRVEGRTGTWSPEGEEEDLKQLSNISIQELKAQIEEIKANRTIGPPISPDIEPGKDN